MKYCSNLYSNFIFRLWRITVVFLISALIAQSSVVKTHAAQDSLIIANYYPIADRNVKDGDIVSFSQNAYILTKTPYDTLVVGVVNTNPAIGLEINASKTSSYPVVSAGNARVNVSTQNGNIKKGDPITSSSTPGVGMLAISQGYILGAALESYSSKNPKTIKQILVNLDVKFFPTRLKFGFFDIFSVTSLATGEEPIKAFKYSMAGLTIVLSFIFAFFSFARTANKGLEALGRNPLASRMIQLGIALNITVALTIVFVGLLVAYIMLRL